MTHALLPRFLLLRRLDPAAVVGSAVARMVGGVGARAAAAAVAVPHSTARDWRRRHRARAPDWLRRAHVLVVELGGELPRGPQDLERAEVDALVLAWRQAARRAAPEPPVGLWSFVSGVTGGEWLGTTTSPPWAGGWGRPLIPTTSSTTP